MYTIFTVNKNKIHIKYLLLTLIVGFGISHVVLASNELLSGKNSPMDQWQPISSDKLIRLPANIIEKRIQQDFQASPMAMRLAELDGQMQDKISNVKALQKSLSQQDALTDSATDTEATATKQFQLLQNKSVYLDLLQESQALRQTAMQKKQQLYQHVLNKLQKKDNKVAGSDTYFLKQAQSKARQRMEKVMEDVDLTLAHSSSDTSIYTSEYAENVAKIDKLKQAIGRHQANASPLLNGIEVSSQEFVRQLLMEVSTEQSLLDQEKLMLSYMAKLVAFDAQSLEYQLSYSSEEEGQIASKSSKAANVTDLFIQE